SLFGRPVVIEWEGTTFREQDRVISRRSDETTCKPEETGHRVEVLLGDGKTGTVTKACNQGRYLIWVEWDPQRWQEAGKRRRGVEVGQFVQLQSFQCCLHVDYVAPAPGAS